MNARHCSDCPTQTRPFLRVLLIEDCDDDAQLLQWHLEQGGYQVEAQRVDSLPAIRQALAESHWDIIISDYRLPGFDGLEAIRLVQQQENDIPVLLVSGAIGEELAVAAMKAGAADFLVKGRLARLVPVIERELREAESRRQRRLAEKALQESEQRLRATFEKAAVGIVEVDAEDRCVAVNERLCQILGYRREELLGMSVHDLTFPEDRQRSEELNAKLHHGLLQTFACEKRYLRRDGSPLWVHVAVSTVRDSQCNIIRSIGTVEDIAERKQAEEALCESEARFRTLANNISQLVWMADATGSTFWYNQRWYDYTGTTREEMDGWGWQAMHHPDHVERVIAKFRRHVELGLVWEDTFPLRGKDGNYRWFLSRAIPICDEQGNVQQWFGTNTDITEQRHTEEALAAAKTSAEQAKTIAEQANRAKDDFLAVLSHELRTPLTPVVMGVSMLQNRADLDPAVQETLEMIRRNTEMEARLIDDLLDVMRITRGKIELARSPVELCTVIHRAIEVCKPEIEAAGLNFRIDFGPDAPYWINADVPRLQQVFWNLLKNAIKFTPHGGWVGVRCCSRGNQVVAEVSDSGIGLEPGSVPRIFNAFEQTERAITRQFGGLGLGLAISKALVEMHDGAIDVESKGRNCGATFRVILPMTTAAHRIVTPHTTSTGCHTRPLRILLVEDHPVTAKMVAMVLALEGHQVEIAGDVATALQLVAANSFDLLISDLGLPDASGHDLMRELRQQGARLPAIALSGYGQEQDIERSHLVGFSAHLTKPASREALLDAVAAVTTAHHEACI